MENLQPKLYMLTRTTYFVDIDMPCYVHDLQMCGWTTYLAILITKGGLKG